MARPGLGTHRKFRRLERALGSRITARGVLELLWDSCYEAGDDYVGTAEDIEHAIGWTGDAGVLTRALAEAGLPAGVGFIERVEGVGGDPVYRVHDLWHHAPEYVAKRRQRELQRQGKSAPDRRGGPDRRTAPNGGHCSETPDWPNENRDTPSPSHSPTPSPDLKNGSSVHGFLEFPVVGPHGPTWTLSEEQCSEWASLFPGLDIKAEARKALAWVRATPGRRKTASGMGRFLVGWFSRAVNDGKARHAHQPAVKFAPSAWTCPDDPPCPPGTTRFRCQQRSQLEAAKRERQAS